MEKEETTSDGFFVSVEKIFALLSVENLENETVSDELEDTSSDKSDDEDELSFPSEDLDADEWIEHIIAIGLSAYQKKYQYMTYSNAYIQQIEGLLSEEVAHYESKYKMFLWAFKACYVDFYQRFIEMTVSENQLRDEAEALFEDYKEENDVSGFSAYLSRKFETLRGESLDIESGCKLG